MTNVSVSQIVNQVDQSNLTLYAKWEATNFKITLFRSHELPLCGQMYTEDAHYYLNHLDETFEMYLEKTREAFSGRNTDVQFFLRDTIFTWKQQNILTRGEIPLLPLYNPLTLADALKQSLELYQKCQEEKLALEKENRRLTENNAKLLEDMEEMISKKHSMEKDLNAKFLLLLNTKKKRIRELEEVLDSKKQTKSAYDETTDDESEKSDLEDNSIFNSKKRKLNYKSEQKTIPKSPNKISLKKCTNFSSSEETSPEPSTSKNKLTLQDTDVRRVHNTMIPNSESIDNHMSEEESEEDLFS